jgi:ArsR family transcriptional regulator
MNLTPVFKLLSDETRLRVILLLSIEELCVCEICGILDEPQPKISKILSKLRDLDLVFDKRKEKYVFYTIKDTNTLLNHTLRYILENMNDYPQLVIDQQRLSTKADYIDQCALETIKEIS